MIWPRLSSALLAATVGLATCHAHALASLLPRSSLILSACPRAAILFLDVADQLQLCVLCLETRYLPLLLDQLRRERIPGFDLWTALPRREPSELASVTRTAPFDEMRRVQTLATKKSPNLAALASVDLLEDLPLVLGGEPSSFGFRSHFRRDACCMRGI